MFVRIIAVCGIEIKIRLDGLNELWQPPVTPRSDPSFFILLILKYLLNCSGNGEYWAIQCEELILPMLKKIPLDIAINNILVRNGKLCAIIDFGQLAVGDPACDLVIAWNFFSGEERELFKNAIQLDNETWMRALGWAFWKTLCWPIKGTDVKKVLHEIYKDYDAVKNQVLNI